MKVLKYLVNALLCVWHICSLSSSIYELSNLELANLGLGASKVKDQLSTLFQHFKEN